MRLLFKIFKTIPTLLGLIKDEDVSFSVITRLGKLYLPNYKFTWPEIQWFYDKKLNSILEKFGEKNGFNAHRRLAIQELIKLTENIKGDTAECGVYLGCGSYIILESNIKSHLHKFHHIFDSFQGLSKPEKYDGTYWTASAFNVSEEKVNENLSNFDKKYFSTYKGWIPDRFEEISESKFSFVHIDVDLYQPTLDSMRFFYERLNSGGIIICDDYGQTTCPGATKAVDEFLKFKEERMLYLPGGGGFIIKGIKISN
ncbi:MAG: macrocin O-methyltransferase [Rickettsiales bacterium]|nr:macrocin O-methyltransferase [Rickettsiales bacterium]